MAKYSSIFLVLFLFACSHSPLRDPAGQKSPLSALSSADQAKYKKLLVDSLMFFNSELRDPASGQYYDAISLDKSAKTDFNTSVAATGMGLVSLALGDALGIIPEARAKAVQSLRFVLGHAFLGGQPYLARRSKAGWFRHWFDLRQGADNGGSRFDGYSTIDTTILVAGAVLAANYFSAVGKDETGELRALADEILFSINWDSAVADLDKGHLWFNFDLATEKPRAQGRVFNEYILVACVGRYSDMKQGRSGKISDFWTKHYASPARLPKKDYDGIELLTDNPNGYLSSFIVQFSSYLCSDVSGSNDYMNFVLNEDRADRRWFERVTDKKYLWGTGAGEVRVRATETAPAKNFYAANNFGNNPNLVVSPHIVAGFLPVDPRGIDDLLTMYSRSECLYHDKNFDLLWRCSLQDLALPFNRIQAVDFSTMFLGLAAFHPSIGGWDFYRKYAPGSGTK